MVTKDELKQSGIQIGSKLEIIVADSSGNRKVGVTGYVSGLDNRGIQLVDVWDVDADKRASPLGGRDYSYKSIIKYAKLSDAKK
jgi:hypothetical protein